MTFSRKYLLMMATAASFIFTAPVQAQSDDGVRQLEEIVVFARKREESLQDVPVSISVIGKDLIGESGIRNAFDLFEMTPGISWDQAQDRQGSQPSVRGIQSNSQGATRQKVNSFLDGLPLLGQQGSLQFVGVEHVEVLRGPQSSAFGRATFAGAINYVSHNPGDEFEAGVQLATSDQDRSEFQLTLAGPINDTFGYTLAARLDELDGPDEWVSSDGVDLGGTSTKYFDGKLTFAPNDSVDGYVRFLYWDVDDEPVMEYFLSDAELDACSNITLGMGVRYLQGNYECSAAVPPGGYPRNHNPELAFTPGTPEFFAAQTYSVSAPSSDLERKRVQGQLSFHQDSGSTIELLSFFSDEEYMRWFDFDATDTAAVVSFPMGNTRVLGVNAMANPSTAEEIYAEVRWLSPGDERLTWLIGASVYDYDFLTTVWNQFAGVVLGLEDEANGGAAFIPNNVIADTATNTGIFANLTYDITENTTLSLEGRFQRDDITNANPLEGASFSSVTESFQPRIGLHHNLTEDVSIYGQLAKGTNPAGVNLTFLDQGRIDSLAAAGAAGFITYDETTFLSFDEESLTNFEVGLKANLADNRLQLAVALYVMEWDKMIQSTSLNWDGAWNDGSFDPDGTVFGNRDVAARVFLNTGVGNLSGLEVEANWLISENWSVRGALTLTSNEYDQFCDPSLLSIGLPPTDTVEDGALTDCVEVGGNTIVRQPEETLVLSPSFRSGPIGNSDWIWTAQVDIRYQGDQFSDTANIRGLPATTIVNGSVSFRNDNWTVRLFGNNLTDDDTPTDVLFEPDNSFGVSGPGRQNFKVRPRLPREIGVQLNYQF